MDTRDFSVDTIQEIYDIIEELKGQGTIGDSIHDFWCIGEPDAIMLCTYASRDEMKEYYEKYADGMDLTKKKFDKIVENVREVDSKYQEEFLKSKEELKNFGETLKNMTEEISLRTLSLDTSHYNLAIGVIEGGDSEKKEKLKELIGITPGTTKKSELLQKIREILKYSTGNGEFDDEINVESEEATLVQKKKLIAQVESLKEQFRNGELTQDELLDKLCEIYHVEDYGSQINYSLVSKKYMPEKKARIVSDILSTAMYIMEEDGLDAEKIEEIARSVKVKSYIEDEMWTMAENAFRGAVVGANAAIAGKYYTGQIGSGGGGLKTVDTGDLKVIETKTPEVANSEWLASGYDKPPYNPDFEVKVVQAGNEEYVRVFSYNVDGTSNKLGGWLMKKSDIEGLTPTQIADKYALPKVPTHICDVNVNPDFNLQTGIANSVEGWGNGGGQQFDTMGKFIDEDAFVNERIIGE